MGVNLSPITEATEIDLADCPDLGPILFTLGCFCSGETVIRNAGRLRLKESDRIEAMQTELRKMGARIEVDGDTVHIQGVALHAPNAPLSGHNDHRIVMPAACPPCSAGPRPWTRAGPRSGACCAVLAPRWS